MKTVAAALLIATLVAGGAVANALTGTAVVDTPTESDPAAYFICDVNPDDWRCAV